MNDNINQKWINQQWRKWHRGIGERLLLVEGGLCLLAAHIMLALFPFQRLMLSLSRPLRQREVTGAKRVHKRQEVRHALFVLRQRFGDRSTCLHRAMAAQVMLRRRRISATLYFGVARSATQELATHAWVQDGEEGVVGYFMAQQDRYTVIASYPQSTAFTHHYFHSPDGDEDEQIRRKSN